MSDPSRHPFSGGADFEVFGPDVVVSRRTPRRDVPSQPVPDLEVLLGGPAIEEEEDPALELPASVESTGSRRGPSGPTPSRQPSGRNGVRFGAAREGPRVAGADELSGPAGSFPAMSRAFHPVTDEAAGPSPYDMNSGAPESGLGPVPPWEDQGPVLSSTVEREFDIVAVLDEWGCFTFVSSSAEDLLGYDVSEVVGVDAFALFDGASAEGMRTLFADLLARRRLSVNVELQTQRADGTPVILDLVAVNHLEDPIGGVVVNIRDITQRVEAERNSRESEQRQVTIIESLADGVMIVNSDGVITRVNEAYEVLFRTPRVHLVGKLFTDQFVEDAIDGIGVIESSGVPLELDRHPVMECLRTGHRVSGREVGVLREGQSPMWLRVSVQAMSRPDGGVAGVVASFVDVTSAHEARLDLRREEQFLQVLLETLDEGIVACDDQGNITVFNPAARRLHGVGDGEDAQIESHILSEDVYRTADGSVLAPSDVPLRRALAGERLLATEVILESRDGARYQVNVNGQPLIDEGRKIGAVVAIHDVTEQRKNEERLADLALHDSLTGLANRTLLNQRLQEAIASLWPGEGPPTGDGEAVRPGIAVFLLDLDEFKEVNDTLGHEVGDDVLVAAARRLLAIVRPTDTVARLGGDEFVVVCYLENGEEEMTAIVDRISAVLSRPYRIDGRVLSVPASVGGVYADRNETDPSKLLSGADDAMYGIKWSRRRQRRSMTD